VPVTSNGAARTYDYVVVGGGTAGAVVAARLVEGDPTLRVALVEAGPSDEGLDRVLRARDWMELLGSDLDYDYGIQPQERGNSAIRHSRARVLGGCSSHNSLISFRAPDRDMADWEARGAAGWGADSVRDAFARVFATVPIAEHTSANPLTDAFLEAAAQAGFPTVAFNADTFTVGAGRFQLAIRDGWRQSSSVAYLHPLAALPDTLEILTDTWVDTLTMEGTRVASIETSAGTLRAEREVVLCAGAIDTPRLLMRSGVGPAAHLRDAGVEVVHDLPAVGEHLLDHPEGVVIWETTRPVPQATPQFWDSGLFAQVEADADGPDLMFHFGLMPFSMNTEPMGFPTAQDGFSLTPNVCHARSEGTVRLDPANPRGNPLVDFRYFTDPDGYDERIMLAGVHLAREIAAQPALASWVRRELAPGEAMTDDAALSDYARRTANTVYHPAGTCRMGAAENDDVVVDPQLRVRGLDGLRVADASIFPSMTSVNPMVTCMMIGERAADLLRAA
jgi:choline oxidase